jgi:hypothetical protein
MTNEQEMAVESNAGAIELAKPLDMAAFKTEPEAGAAIVVPKPTIDDLDAAVEKVLYLKTETARGYWELGRKISEIYDARLWKLRVREDGKTRYTAFAKFCEVELLMSEKNARMMMAAAASYSADDIEKIGRTNIGLILQAAPKDRPHLESAAKAGASSREVKSLAQESRKRTGYAKPSRQAKAGKASAAKTAKVPTDKVTIAKIEGTRTVKLYARPETLKNIDFKKLKRAKTLAAQPFGRLEITPGVVMWLSVQKDNDGDIEFKVDTRREATA